MGGGNNFRGAVGVWKGRGSVSELSVCLRMVIITAYGWHCTVALPSVLLLPYAVP